MNQIKKKVLRPHIARVQTHTFDALFALRETEMGDLDERAAAAYFRGSPNVKKLAMVVYVSINHLLPAQPVAP